MTEGLGEKNYMVEKRRGGKKQNKPNQNENNTVFKLKEVILKYLFRLSSIC
eukprot:m.54913 g.54913  ORF g.54913 m.54913 type:complete len:51 (+) comp18566_c0_seq2:55-207(+)